jgi:glycosyltransferase involved in cell wall biosynthesis
MKLSICCITYNHEKFIAQALDGFLIQKTNFDYEIVIGEDCSTDKTLEIIKNYQQEYPNRIKLLANKTNIGMIPNFVQTMEVCTGKYIALCEGDDYWNDPYKLQKQVDFLEANPDYVICFHPVVIENLVYNKKEFSSNQLKSDSTFFDLARQNYLPTPSTVFRNNISSDLIELINKCPIGDYPLFLYLAKAGNIHFINEHMAVYRVHEHGVWNHQRFCLSRMKMIQTLEILKKTFHEITDDLMWQQSQLLRTIAQNDPELLSQVPDTIIALIDKVLSLKNANIEIERKYSLLSNSRLNKLRNTFKRKI